MKKHLFFGFILIVCALGAFVILNEYIYQEKREPNPLPVGDVTLTGVVTAIDTEQMMVDGPAVVSYALLVRRWLQFLISRKVR